MIDFNKYEEYSIHRTLDGAETMVKLLKEDTLTDTAGHMIIKNSITKLYELYIKR